MRSKDVGIIANKSSISDHDKALSWGCIGLGGHPVAGAIVIYKDH